MEVGGGSPWPGHKGVTPKSYRHRRSAQLFRDTISKIIKSGTCGRMSYHFLQITDEQIEAQRAKYLV